MVGGPIAGLAPIPAAATHLCGVSHVRAPTSLRLAAAITVGVALVASGCTTSKEPPSSTSTPSTPPPEQQSDRCPDSPGWVALLDRHRRRMGVGAHAAAAPGGLAHRPDIQPRCQQADALAGRSVDQCRWGRLGMDDAKRGGWAAD